MRRHGSRWSSETGRRLYDNAAIARLRFVRRCRDLGMHAGCGRVARPIAQRLAKIERTIMVHLDRCSDDLAKCPMLNDLLYGLDAPALPD